MGDVEQWVNLPKDGALVDGKVLTTTERMGGVYVLLKFAKKDVAAAKYRVVPDGGNQAYEPEELTRPAGFALRAKGTAVGADGEVDPNVPLDLPACGANKYVIEAKDGKGNVVQTSDTIVAKRLIQYQLVRVGPFSDDAKKAIDQVSKSLEDELAKEAHTVKLLRVDGNGDASPMAVRDMLDEKGDRIAKGRWDGAFLDHVEKLVKLKNPAVGFLLCWVPHLARKKRSMRIFQGARLDRSPSPGGLDSWSLDDKGKRLVVRLPAGTHLWHGFDDAEDTAKHWFHSATLSFKRPGAADAENREALLRFAVHASLAGSPAYGKHGYRSLALDLADVWDFVEKRKSLEVEIAIRLHVVEGWSNGLSYVGSGAIAMAEQVHWTPRARPAQQETLLHEVGHRLGLTANGDKTTVKLKKWTPNGPPKYYDETTVKGTTHTGGHCGLDMTWDAKTKAWSGTPGCVMFGSSFKGRKATLCDPCGVSLRKADLSNIQR